MSKKNSELIELLFAREVKPELFPPPSSLEEIKLFEQIFGFNFPSLLVEILLRANGGDFSFGRFDKTPFITNDLLLLSPEQAWVEYLSYLSMPDVIHPLITERKIFPLVYDYGTGYSCLDLTSNNSEDMQVLYLGDYMGDEDLPEFEAVSFFEFVLKSVNSHK